PVDFFLSLLTQPIISTLFPYTTLFRSQSPRTTKCRHILNHGVFVRRIFVDDTHCSIAAICAESKPRLGIECRSVGTESVVHEDSDRKSTRLNSSHSQISYAVFCLKKKK